MGATGGGASRAARLERGAGGGRSQPGVTDASGTDGDAGGAVAVRKQENFQCLAECPWAAWFSTRVQKYEQSVSNDCHARVYCRSTKSKAFQKHWVTHAVASSSSEGGLSRQTAAAHHSTIPCYCGCGGGRQTLQPCMARSVDHRLDWLRADFIEVDLGVKLLFDLADHSSAAIAAAAASPPPRTTKHQQQLQQHQDQQHQWPLNSAKQMPN